MTSIRFDESTARWEVAVSPMSSWSRADHLASDLTVFRAADGAVAALVVDAGVDGAVRPEVVSLVRDLVGPEVAARFTAVDRPSDLSSPRPAGSIVHLGADNGVGFAIDEHRAPPGVDGSRPGRVDWDAESLSLTMTVPVTGDSSVRDGLWASVVDEATGDVIAAGRLLPRPGGESSTRLTVGVPFAADDLRVELSRSAPNGVSVTASDVPPKPVFWYAVAGVVALVVATIWAAFTAGRGVPGVGSVVIASGFEGLAMVVEMVVAAFLVERLWRFRLLRPWVGFVVVASVFAYSNLMYALANVFDGFGTWFSSAAERIQQVSLLALPFAAGWALYRIIRKGTS